MRKYEILNSISEQDIFNKYVGPVALGKMIRSPLRKENTASFHIIQSKERLIFKDFGSGESGDCFKFIQLMFRVSFSDALNIIEEDFKLIRQKRPPVKRKLSFYSIIPKKTEQKSSQFEYTEKEFTIDELNYWNSFGISLNILQEYDIISVKRVKEVKWRDYIVSTPNCPIFAYKYTSGHIRFYRPLAFDRRFFGNSNMEDVFGYEQAVKASQSSMLHTICICAGQKDSLSFYSNTQIRTICLNSESSILTEELFARLKAIARNIVICYDMDKTGRENTQKIISKYNLQDVMINFRLKEGEKDVSNYYKRINKTNPRLDLIDKL